MIKALNFSITKKLIWLIVLTIGVYFVSNRTNESESVVPANQPVVKVQNSFDATDTQNVADSLPDFRSTYQFNESKTERKKR